jgi:hypothetical protein
MYSFESWLAKKHPEILREDWRKNLGSLALASASLFPISSKGNEQPNVVSVSSDFQSLNSLREIYNILKKQSDFGERKDIGLIVKKLGEVAPEYYGPFGSDKISASELAGLPDDSFFDFLNKMAINIRENEKMQKMPIADWRDKNGSVVLKARYLKFDSPGWVWFQKQDGEKIRVPLSYLSDLNQQQIKNIYKLSVNLK